MRADARFFAAAVLMLSLPQVAADMLLGEREATGIAMILGFATLYVQLLVTFRTLDHAGAAPPGYTRANATEGRFPTAFAASFVSGIGMLIGLILFVVPGVIAFLLWSLTLPVIAAERLSAMASLRRSVALARAHLATLALVGLAIALAIIGALGISLAADLLPEPAGALAFSLWLNLSVSAILLFGAVAWARAYLALRSAAA
ncbi:hypothetical protein M9980_10175 [Sphingomonas donggukensis]|uniref:Glycerophosphoryl diester phosphodiesterase membrane domain-containing protein n=1 Tax=Sphingomonas donggukensis TaxID=2949093 RepID=A0ABY4TRJ2_9SPHN|nr:hypothetical protein [Sphingomonas donggukensis]URW74928.1 hypothetical protein M9980_10175 [Sphingomonas donggukensis]